MEEEKKKNGLVVPFIISIILLIGLAGYIYYDKFYEKEDGKIQEKQDKYPPIQDGKKLSDAEIEKILDERLPSKMCGEFDDLYQENGFNIKDLGEGDILYWISLMINSATPEEATVGELTIDDIQKVVNNYVLNAPTITMDNLKENSISNDEDIAKCKQSGDFNYTACNYDYTLGYIYYSIIDNNTVKIEPMVTGCDDAISFEKKIINNNESDNKLEVDLKVAFVEADDSPNIYIKQAYALSKYAEMDYSDYATETLVEEDDSNDYNINWDLYSTYRMTFIKQNGNYYLDNVKLIDKK